MFRRCALLIAFAAVLPTAALAGEAEVVTLTTSDDWTLEGDYWKGAEGAPDRQERDHLRPGAATRPREHYDTAGSRVREIGQQGTTCRAHRDRWSETE